MNIAPHEKEVVVPLLAIESSKALMEESGVTAVTFYRGDMANASAYIRTRFKAIVDANPWLAGRLVRDKQLKNVQLVHPQTPVSEDVINQLFHPNPSGLQVGSEIWLSISEIGSKVLSIRTRVTMKDFSCTTKRRIVGPTASAKRCKWVNLSTPLLNPYLASGRVSRAN